MELDQEIALMTQAAEPAGHVQLDVNDIGAVRASIDAEFAAGAEAFAPVRSVRTEDVEIEGVDGFSIRLRWYHPVQRRGDAIVVYAHGGGLIGGSLNDYDRLVRLYCHRSGLRFVSLDYRLAPDHGGVAPAEDVFSTLAWLRRQALSEGATTPLAVMGDSAGGGIAAAAAVMARDRGLELAPQILIYPMLDDRTQEVDPHMAEHLTWSCEDNRTGWTALLGESIQAPDVSPYLAPARLEDFARLAPAYVEVGDVDLFRDESLRYVMALLSAGVPSEVRVYSGAPHGFDWVAPDSRRSARALDDRVEALEVLLRPHAGGDLAYSPRLRTLA